MAKVREGRDYEGEVLYFMDSDNNTVGLLKKKTTWYIILRAIREKVSHVWSTYRYLENLLHLQFNLKIYFRKNPGGWSASLNASHLAKLNKRLDEIQRWLSLSDQDTMVWKMRGRAFQTWLVTKLVTSRPGDIDKLSVRGNFPQLWKLFNLETKNGEKSGYTSGMEHEEVAVVKTGNILEDSRGSSPSIEICDESFTSGSAYIGAFILRNVDLLGKNLRRLTSAQQKTHKKVCDNKKLALISFHDLDKLKSKKLTFNITENGLCSPELSNDDTTITESSENILVVIQSDKTEEILTTVFNALIQQIFHLAIRLNCVEKSVHVEKVKISHGDNFVKCFPDSLPNI